MMLDVKLAIISVLLLFALGAVMFENYQLKQFTKNSGPPAFVKTTGQKIQFPWKGEDLQHIPYVWKEHVASRVFEAGNCSCPNGTYHARPIPNLGPDELRQAMQGRDKEKERLKQRAPPPTPILFANGRSPLSYPTQGLRVQPMKSLVIPGLKLEELTMQEGEFEIQLRARLGVLTVLADVPGVAVQGLGSKHLTIFSTSLEHLNRQLQFLVYTNIDFDPDTVDYVGIQYIDYNGSIPIRIRHKTLPQLFRIVEDDITTKVTVVTKTFIRYDKLRQLISSMRQFYPNITIIIADDSNNPEKVEGQNIEHYIMPYRKGWFAGRNLGVSQVTTPYFLWVDDDYVFTPKTRIELLLQVIESTNIDVVGGVVGGGQFQRKIIIEDGGDLGDCLYRILGSYHPVEGFPKCAVTDVVTNFFLADTIKARRAGFDPRFTRMAHSEFFQDGLGELRVASCSHVSIGHNRGGGHGYNKFRYMNGRSSRELYMFLLYKYNLKCLSHRAKPIIEKP